MDKAIMEKDKEGPQNTQNGTEFFYYKLPLFFRVFLCVLWALISVM
jgi:hypothetical protein